MKVKENEKKINKMKVKRGVHCAIYFTFDGMFFFRRQQCLLAGSRAQEEYLPLNKSSSYVYVKPVHIHAHAHVYEYYPSGPSIRFASAESIIAVEIEKKSLLLRRIFRFMCISYVYTHSACTTGMKSNPVGFI